jgi:hypothetical protein
MEQAKHREHESESLNEPEIQASVEIETDEQLSVDLLPARLGFAEDQEMVGTRQRWIEAARARIAVMRAQGSSAEEEVADYAALVDKLEARHGAVYEVGLLIAKASVYRDAGKTDYYQEELADALNYANNLGLDEVVEVLEGEIETAG